MVLTLYDRYGNMKAELPPEDGSTQDKEIQGDNILSLSFTLYEHVPIDVGDYVDFLGERYRAVERYNPAEKSSVEWEYDVRLYGMESLLNRFLVTNGGEAVFSLTARPAEHLRLIVKCINDGMDHTTDWKAGQVEGTENVTIRYEGKYCGEALKELAEAVGTEYWTEGTTVNLSRCEYGAQVTLGYGKGLTGLDRDKADNAKFYTRLFPTGSSRNIDPEKYGSSRLHLPGGAEYVEIPELVEQYGTVDHYESAAFSGIFPRRVGTVSSVRREDVKDSDGNPYTIYYFKDSGLSFNPNDYEIGGLVKRVSFQEGSELAGLGQDESHYFEVNWNEKTKEFEIITIWPYDDERQLPGGSLVPKVGDQYILWNIRMPDEYYGLAEQEFQTAVEEYNAKHRVDVSRYKAGTDHVWMEETGTELHVGLRVRLESAEYFPGKGYKDSRITRISRKVCLPGQMDIEISDALSTGTLDKLSDTISDVRSYAGGILGSVNVPDVIRSWDTTLPTDSNLFSARRSQQEFLSKKKADRAREPITFEKGVAFGREDGGRIDGDGNAELLTLVVRELLRSPEFRNGWDGEGWRLAMEDGLAKLELDELTVRRVMHVMELIMDRLRSVGGQIAVSAANGKIKTVEDDGDSYRITFEQGNTYEAHDLLRCATYAGGAVQRTYWVEVAEAEAGLTEGSGWARVPKSEFAEWGTAPAAGDETVLMGNTENALRQNMILISAAEDGQPRIDVMDGIREKNFTGCLRARLGSLDGIKDGRFPTDNQPHGNGLYADNAYLRGTFLLSTGEDIKTKFEIVEGRIQSVVDSLREDIVGKSGYLGNAAFSAGLSRWETENATVFWLSGNRWIRANGGVLASHGDGAVLLRDMERTVVRIRNSRIVQTNGNLRAKPVFVTDGEGQREAAPVYLTFFYRCSRGGRLRVWFDGVDKSGFANFNSMDVSEEIAETAGYVQHVCDGLWNGTGDFRMEFTGEIYVYMLLLTSDKTEALAYRYRTLFEQSERLVRIAAAVYDRDGNALQETGLVVKPEGSGLYAQGADGKVALVGVAVEETDADGKTKTVIKLTADNIRLEGLVTANHNFKILDDGSVEAVNSRFTGRITATEGSIAGFDISGDRLGVGDGQKGMSLTSGRIWFTDGDRELIMGTYNRGTSNIIDRLGELKNTSAQAYPNYGLIFNVTGSLVHRNYAFCGTGNGVLQGLVEGYSLRWTQINEGEARELDVRYGKYFELYSDASGCAAQLPRLSVLREALNVPDTRDIALRITIVCRHCKNPIRLQGRKDNAGVGIDSAEYPYIRDNDFNPWHWDMGMGDIMELLLTYSGGDYNAYLVSYRG